MLWLKDVVPDVHSVVWAWLYQEEVWLLVVDHEIKDQIVVVAGQEVLDPYTYVADAVAGRVVAYHYHFVVRQSPYSEEDHPYLVDSLPNF